MGWEWPDQTWGNAERLRKMSSYTDLAGGHGGLAGMGSYNHVADTTQQNILAGQRAQAYAARRDEQQAAHEQALQAQEQKRRNYDSETARDMQQRKMGLLSGLLGSSMSGGYQTSRKFGDVPSSQRRMM